VTVATMSTLSVDLGAAIFFWKRMALVRASEESVARQGSGHFFASSYRTCPSSSPDRARGAGWEEAPPATSPEPVTIAKRMRPRLTLDRSATKMNSLQIPTFVRQ
jgi:hypothetical protein